MRRKLIMTLLAFMAMAAPAGAATSSSWSELGAPKWAAVNVCDSGSHSLGVRASMPGDALGRRMFIRFSTQWFNHGRGAWRPVAGSESPWLDAGPGPWLYRSTGWTRSFAPAPAGASFLLRGVVEMQWRSGGAVASTQTLVTPQTCTLR